MPYGSEGILEAGRAIAEGIQRYQQNRQEDEFLRGTFEQYVSSAPQLGLEVKPEDIAKFSGASLGAKRGIVSQLAMQADMKMKAAQLAEYQRRLDADVAMEKFSHDFSNTLATAPALSDYYENPERHAQAPAPDALAAFQGALSRNPRAAADERFGSMINAYAGLMPQDKAYAPSANQKDVEFLIGQGYERDDAIAKVFGNRAEPEPGEPRVAEVSDSRGRKYSVMWSGNVWRPLNERDEDVQLELIRYRRLNDELAELRKSKTWIRGDTLAKVEAQEKEVLGQMRDVEDRMGGGGEAPAKDSPAKQKAALANRLAGEHPDWSRQQIIEEVNRRIP